MKFSASDIEFVTWSMREQDTSRSQRRALIQASANGVPPFSEKQADQMRLPVNFNDLTHTRELHNARAQFTSSFTKPGRFFNATTDSGPKFKRDGYGKIVTKEAAKVMKNSLSYFETMRSKFATLVLHGISPCVYQDHYRWASKPIGVEDIYVPSNTDLIDIADNTLPMFAVYRSLKIPQLIKMAKGPVTDKGWNQDLVDSCIKWGEQEMLKVAGTNWQNYWQPEKNVELIKSDGGIFASDSVPTINVFDFYYWNDDKKVQGYNRRMILDYWTMPGGPIAQRSRRTGGPYDDKATFLYDPGDRKWASKISEIVNWQFADLSATAPFRYHSVRSLGYLLYAVCQVQNRLNCKFTASMFEQLMVLMKVKSQDDMQRALSVNLVDYGFVDDSIEFIKAADRYQVNAQLQSFGMSHLANLVSKNAASFTSKVPGSTDNKIPTATQWMGEEQKVTQLVAAGLQQAYEYQKPEYRETFRRFLIKDSEDPEVRHFQDRCLRQGVPEKVLYNHAAWDVEPERTIGAGNKTLAMMTVDWMMANWPKYGPDAQRKILEIGTLEATDDPALTEVLVPETVRVSNSIHDAQMSVGTLLLGQPMEFRENVNHGEYAEALLGALEVEIVKIQNMGGVPDQAQLPGLQNLAGQSIDGQPIPGNGAFGHIQLFAQDPENKAKAKMLNDQLGKLMNEVKAFQQRLMEQQANAQAQGQGLDPETEQKIVSMQALTDSKMEANAKSNAQRTAVRQVQDERKMERDSQQFQMDMAQKQQEHAQEMQLTAQKNALEVTKAAQLAAIEVEKSKKTAQEAAKQPKPAKQSSN